MDRSREEKQVVRLKKWSEKKMMKKNLCTVLLVKTMTKLNENVLEEEQYMKIK
jgi:hypothetical protein